MAYINGTEILFSAQVNTVEGVNAEEYEKIKAENAELETENAELETENAELETENATLKARNKAVTTENANLVIQNDRLEAERDELHELVFTTIEGGVKAVFIPDNIEVIREYAYYRHKMTGVTFPASVKRIARAAFHTCTNCLVYDFLRHETVPVLDDNNAFNNISADAKIKVPAALYNEWVADTNWATYIDNIVAAVDGIITPDRDSRETAAVGVAHNTILGFYISDNFTAGKCYVSLQWIDEDGIVRYAENELTTEVTDSTHGLLLTMGVMSSDNYEQGEFSVDGVNYDGDITFFQAGTYRIYRKYIDAVGNEYSTGAYIYEVV